MVYTRHGHHIPNTTKDEERPTYVARCGGPKICAQCKYDVETYQRVFIGTPTDYPSLAKTAVKEIVDQRIAAYLTPGGEMTPYEIYVVSFSFVLGSWKAFVGTTLDDKMYYEVTYSAEKRETYVSAYRALETVTIPDRT
jgi:hypothetical protein